jgi:hypothetical protein
VSGPGAVVFGTPGAVVTTATFSGPGSYTLRLTASDSELSVSDDVVVLVQPRAAGRTWTTDADFDLGVLDNVEHVPGDQLQLTGKAGAFPFIWIAVSSKGTIVKIDTRTGQILGEYSTSPAGQPKDPSRTTVDLNGNVGLPTERATVWSTSVCVKTGNVWTATGTAASKRRRGSGTCWPGRTREERTQTEG